MASSTVPFTFPREYSFPPFFSRQPNIDTHHSQLATWSDIILAYCKHHRLFKLSLSAAVPSSSSSAAAPTSDPAARSPHSGNAGADNGAAGPRVEELFHNKKLNKRLSLSDAREVIEFMRRDGRAEYVGGGTGDGDVVWVYWRTPEEWASLVEAWVEETGHKGAVVTLYELIEGEDTKRAGRPSRAFIMAPLVSRSGWAFKPKLCRRM